MSYILPINFATELSSLPPATISLAVAGDIPPGLAMGVMGLPYSVITYTQFTLVVVTKEGVTASVSLNAK